MQFANRGLKIFDQFFNGNRSLLEDGLECFWFDAAMHRDARMEAALDVVAVGAGLPRKIEAESF